MTTTETFTDRHGHHGHDGHQPCTHAALTATTGTVDHWNGWLIHEAGLGVVAWVCDRCNYIETPNDSLDHISHTVCAKKGIPKTCRHIRAAIA